MRKKSVDIARQNTALQVLITPEDVVRFGSGAKGLVLACC